MDVGRVMRGARFILIIGMVAVPALWLLYRYAPHHDGAVVGTAVGILCVVVLANGLWENLYPPEFTIDVIGNTVAFQFRDRARAEEFATVNGMAFNLPPTNV